MKTMGFILMAFILMLSMVACSKEGGSETTGQDVVTEQETTEPENTEPENTEPEPSEPETEEPVGQALDMEAVYQNILVTINADEEFILFPESNPAIIEELYEGLSAVELNQTVFYIHPITGFACEIMLVEVANDSDVQTVKDIFEGRITLGKDDTFYAETAALWKTNAQVQASGNYVCMIALPTGYEIPENVFGE